MAISKVQYGNTTLMDLTEDTISPEVVLDGYIGHSANGESFIGNYTPVSNTLGVGMFGLNGEYEATNYGLDGFSRAYVEVGAKLGEIDITESGTYMPETYNLDGFNRVNVDVDTSWKPKEYNSAINTGSLIPYGFVSNACGAQTFINIAVSVGPNVTNVRCMFYECDWFNSKVSLHDEITDCAFLFYNCKMFNQPFVTPKKCTNLRAAFYYGHNMNSPITIGNNVKDCSDMMFWQYNFNQNMNIPDSVTNMSQMFNRCNNFNPQVFKWSNNAVNMAYAFTNCGKMQLKDYDLVIPDTATNVCRMFSWCSSLNPNSFHIGANVIDASAMFNGCSSFNAPITSDAVLQSAAGMFSGCSKFNKPIDGLNLENGTYTSMGSMFNACKAFNQPVNIRDGVTSVIYMFNSATVFNQPLDIPNSVTNMNHFLNNAQMYNQDVYVSAYVTDLDTAFDDCPLITDIYINGQISPATRFNNMIGRSRSQNINIHTSPDFIATLATKPIVALIMSSTVPTYDENYYNEAYKIQLVADYE